MNGNFNAASAKKDEQIVNALRQVFHEFVVEKAGGYFDASRSAEYIGISARSFESGPAKQIPSHRLTPKGKRLYRKEDLDAYMLRHRQLPTSSVDVDGLVDSVITQVRGLR
jgi:hypothetical protein